MKIIFAFTRSNDYLKKDGNYYTNTNDSNYDLFFLVIVPQYMTQEPLKVDFY